MRLLLLEDDQKLSDSLKNKLVAAGFAVDQSFEGIDGGYMGESEPYDAVILDLGLPGRSGLEILRDWRLKKNQVPVLILTARDAWQEKVEGFKAGADDYLAKPFHIEELIARIKALLHRSQNQSAGEISISGLSLDEDLQRVTIPSGATLSLSGTEFRLLRYFMMHPEVILSKTRLTEHIYDFESDKDSNLIEVYIKRLRQKIGKDLIETRRGQGYIFRKVDEGSSD